MRAPAWPEALRDYITAASAHAWRWGTNDCCTFARGAVLAAGGPDLGQDWLGSYTEEAGAADVMHAFGRNLEDATVAICHRAGLNEGPPLLAQRGSLLIMAHPQFTANLPIVAVCIGAYGATFTKSGFTRLPMRATLRAWII